MWFWSRNDTNIFSNGHLSLYQDIAKIASAYPGIARLNAPPKSSPDLRSLQQGLHHVEAIACLYARYPRSQRLMWRSVYLGYWCYWTTVVQCATQSFGSISASNTIMRDVRDNYVYSCKAVAPSQHCIIKWSKKLLQHYLAAWATSRSWDSSI